MKNLCRYCDCPQEETDEPYKDHNRKTQAMITELVRKKDLDALKLISQSNVFNAWYEIWFGRHNKYGVHGACPMEVLHWILLGMFKYTRGMLFDQCGPTSGLSKSVNTGAEHMGWLFQRQSDKTLPRTKFTKGVQKGMLMGNEMLGVMLVLAATLR